jgi:hypothetical protein
MGISYRSASGGKGTVGSKIGMTLFGMVFGSIGLFIMVMAVRSGQEGRARQSWLSTPCVVEQVNVNGTSDGYRLALQYTYSHDGKTFKSDQFGSGATFDDVATRNRMLSTYALESTHTCYVNPAAPAEAIMHRGSGSIGAIVGPVAFCSIFVLIGYGMAFAAWCPRRKRAATATATRSATSGATSARTGKVVGVIFCAIFIVVGLVVTNFTFLKPYQLQQAAKSWVTADAVVLESTVRAHRGDDSTTYSVYIAYEYRVDGRKYSGDRFRFTGGSSSGRDGKARVVRQYPKGHRFQVYIDPEDPWQSVIQRDAGKGLYLMLLPLIFTLVGFAILIPVLKGTTTGRGAKGRARHAARQQGHRAHADSLATVFEPSSGHAGRVFGTAIVAIIWNGIISVFVVQVVKGWMQGAKPIGMTLGISIFVAIGLGAIAALIHSILRIFNPRIEIQSPPVILGPGVTTGLAFTITGNLQRLQTLTITLIGEEQATYRRGTDTHTDTSEFCALPLYEAHGSRISRRGSLQLAIPVDAMHSFESSHNKIIWKVKLHGDIPRWPDVSETYTLNIVPKELCS